ncbi:MAG: hypothetical protein IJG65_02245 [Synergistaceae bacterium]|nr:hypothetical protein [Synergistaceae bacterium]
MEGYRGMSLLGKIEGFTRKYLYFTPYYNRKAGLDPREPEIYNREGERVHVFFISDREFAHGPYWSYKVRYILWDRYNFGLKTHFYSHYEAFRTVGNPERRYAMLTESRAVSPKSYRKFIRNKSYIENEFDALFTFDDEILGTFGNARFVPFCAGYWYGRIDRNITIDPENYTHKSRNVSMLASDKTSCRLHVLRKDLAFRCRNEGLADTFGTFDGGEWVTPERTLKDYRYSVIIENDITPYFFTEKITNCFAAQTIPVYLGATRISEFFNPDGIIMITENDAANIGEVLRQCTPEEYERRLPAVLENFRRVKEYENPCDYMYVKHLAGTFGQ